MPSSLHFFGALFIVGAAAVFMPATSRADLPALIPRSVLFGNPVKASPHISPDGKLLAYLAPDQNGVLGIRVQTIGKTDDRLVASDPSRPIRNVLGQEDGKHVLYTQDRNGDENTHVYQAAIASGKSKD